MKKRIIQNLAENDFKFNLKTLNHIIHFIFLSSVNNSAILVLSFAFYVSVSYWLSYLKKNEKHSNHRHCIVCLLFDHMVKTLVE